MDTGTIIITLILLSACTLPFILMTIKRKNKEKQLLQSLQILAQNNQAVISQYDVWSKSAIGMDESTNQAFFFRHLTEGETRQHVNLSAIKHCRIIKTSKDAEAKHNNQLEKLELVFTYKDSHISDTPFELYNVSHDGFTLNGELQIADKWFKILNAKAEAF